MNTSTALPTPRPPASENGSEKNLGCSCSNCTGPGCGCCGNCK